MIDVDGGAPYEGGTAEEFMAAYAAGRGVSPEYLREHGRVPRYVAKCADYPFPHWEMGRGGDGSAAPPELRP